MCLRTRGRKTKLKELNRKSTGASEQWAVIQLFTNELGRHGVGVFSQCWPSFRYVGECEGKKTFSNSEILVKCGETEEWEE